VCLLPLQEVLGELLVEEASSYVLGEEGQEEAGDMQLQQVGARLCGEHVLHLMCHVLVLQQQQSAQQ
jgi:hypothetical protein